MGRHTKSLWTSVYFYFFTPHEQCPDLRGTTYTKARKLKFEVVLEHCYVEDAGYQFI